MKKRSLSLIACVLLGILALPGVEAGQLAPLDVKGLAPDMLVKITRLTGIGPDGRRLVLMEAAEGVIVPIGDFSALSSSFNELPHRSPAAYHTLQAEMVPALFAMDSSGTRVRLASPDRFPKLIPLIGAVLKLDNGVRMLGVRPQTPTPEDPRYLPRHHEEYED
ncbi:MAG: hypothetical protein P8171_08995 [Candidatus Thiodiazotropha sp.]